MLPDVSQTTTTSGTGRRSAGSTDTADRGRAPGRPLVGVVDRARRVGNRPAQLGRQSFRQSTSGVRISSAQRSRPAGTWPTSFPCRVTSCATRRRRSSACHAERPPGDRVPCGPSQARAKPSAPLPQSISQSGWVPCGGTGCREVLLGEESRPAPQMMR